MERTIFTQRVNQEKDIEAVADGYKTKINNEFWLADGLQKDAVQNSWDARIDKKHGKEWECGFSLVKINNKDVLCISDTGTTGLNGTKFSTHDQLTSILEKIVSGNQRGEDLACFLNSNWSAKSSEEGGNRGRGKTLFLVASQNKKVFFESLRLSDNSYVFGEFYLDNADKQVKFSLHYDTEGKKMLTSELVEVEPITKHGTRIFIFDPDVAVVQAIKDGELISFISNSRWETIKKYGAKIFVDDGKEKKYAGLPYWYENTLKGVEEKEFPPEKIKEGTEYKIKRLILRYAPNLNLPDSIRGIAIQRGGMTIERIPAEELVKEQGMTDIYGWLEMEGKPLEEEMKIRCEGPEHFNFTWNINPARYLRSYIQGKIREFAKDLKIIESEQAKKNKIQKTAEEEALKLLSPLFKKLGLFGKHNKSGKKRKEFNRKKNELLRLSVPDIQFPRDNRRVNYGEKINGAYVVPINEFGESILALIRVFVVSAEGKTEILQEKEINLPVGEGPKIGVDEIVISKKYKAGGYSLRARMIALEDKDKNLPDGTKIEKGTILYERVNQKFYVEIDPPESGPFEFQPKGKDDRSYLFEWEQEGDGYIIYYNELHPRIKPLLNDGEKLRDYFTEQGSLLALQIKLEELVGEDDKEDKAFTELVKNKDTSAVYKLFLNKHSEFLWSLKE